MNLAEGTIRKRYSVMGIDLPLALERRLESLGILPGTKIDILNKKSQGALIIFVRGTRFAIGKGIAEHIAVEEVPA